MSFDRCNIHELALERVTAHGGKGQIAFARIADHEAMDGHLNFIDLAVVPPGVTIGRHQHRDTEEEYYLVLEGQGVMWRDGEELTVRAGDLIRNRPGGTHELHNTGEEPIRLFVFEVSVAR